MNVAAGLEQNEAMRWFKAAAAQKHTLAHYILGTIYQTLKDDKKARGHYKTAAEAGLVYAQNDLAGVYFGEYQRGIKESGRLALEWYRKAAVQGSDCAQCMLGLFMLIFRIN